MSAAVHLLNRRTFLFSFALPPLLPSHGHIVEISAAIQRLFVICRNNSHGEHVSSVPNGGSQRISYAKSTNSGYLPLPLFRQLFIDKLSECNLLLVLETNEK